MAHFNPRSPYGERRLQTMPACTTGYFNPRSPYGERLRAYAVTKVATDFNPRSPYGERLQALLHRIRQNEFQSTLPIRGAT